MSDNQTLDNIDTHIRILQRELKAYKLWVSEDYSHFEKYAIKKDPSEVKKIFV